MKVPVPSVTISEGVRSRVIKSPFSPPAAAPMQRLPDDAYRARLVPRGNWRARAGSRITVAVAVTNASPVAWEPYERSGVAHGHSDHYALVDAIARRDGKRAARLMAAHVDELESRLALDGAVAPSLAEMLGDPGGR